jgi:hypothetical protein
MWWPCLLTDRDEMNNLHRGHSIDASYQVSVVAMCFGYYGNKYYVKGYNFNLVMVFQPEIHE